MISAFDILKVGVEPSSSRTIRPMNAGKNFIDLLVSSGGLPKATHIVIDLYGSLSLTGEDHATGVVIMMGLADNSPQSVNIDPTAGFTREVARTRHLPIAKGTHIVDFSPDKSILFHAETLPRHGSGMHITTRNGTEMLLSKTYYSAGGGFIVEEEQFGQTHDVEAHVPYNFHSASKLLKLCERNGLSVPSLMTQNELAMRSREEVDAGFAVIWDVMYAGIERGMNTEDVLPGPSNVPYRAVALRRSLVSSDNLSGGPMNIIDWINMFTLAVSEKNAAGYRAVTTPINGTCGIIPAVLVYYDKFRRPVNANSIARYLLAVGAIGTLYRMNASISGAEVGCQDEIGVTYSMATAGPTELLSNSPPQVCIAAEVAIEHNLGPTCGPVAGQVQIPCTERNAINAVKAINAARMALRRTSRPRISLGKVIEAMCGTGKGMNDKYREMSCGDLAIKVICT